MTIGLGKKISNKTLLYVFYGYIIFSLGVLAINVLRNFDSLIEPLFTRPPDLFLVTYSLSILLGSFCTYRLILFYKESLSSQYLVLAVFTFGMSVTMFLWQMWLEFFSLVNLDISLAWTSYIEPEIMIGQANYFIGMIAMLIYAIRLRVWNDYHILVKIFFIWLLYENIVMGFLYWPVGRTLLWLDILPFGYWENPQFLLNLISPYYIVTTAILPELISFYAALFNPIGFGVPLFFVYAYLSAKPEISTSKIFWSRVFWILFGLSNIILELISIFDLASFFGIQTASVWYGLLSVKQTIILSGLAILFVLAPEALLITRAQIFQAKALYRKVERGELGPPVQSNVLDYKSRFRTYIDSFPAELKAALKKEQTES
ncbi:MAG: hypothetical protein EAX86_06405 [Candidatus Heimdallarchaeota archaeon]|nr:hypothetical protein [Candidatus Heimdallarchaeota archaeon]